MFLTRSRIGAVAFAASLVVPLSSRAQDAPQCDLRRRVVLEKLDSSYSNWSSPPLIVTATSGGEAFVAFTDISEIRTYDAHGAEQRRFGRFGSGPGAFRMLGSLGWVGDTLWAADAPLQAINLFDRTGNLLTTRPLLSFRAPGGEFITGTPLAVLADGSIVALARPRARSVVSEGLAQVPLLRLYPRGGVDTLWIRDIRHTVLALGTPELRRYTGQPLSDAPILLAAATGAYFVVVDRRVAGREKGSHFTLTSVTARGDTIRTLDYAYVPQPLPRALADSLVSWATDVALGAPAVYRNRADAEVVARDSVFLPHYLPPVSGGLIGRDGTIWLRHFAVDGPSVMWTVVNHDGLLLCRFRAPTDLTLLAVEREVAWGWERNPDGGSDLASYALLGLHAARERP